MYTIEYTLDTLPNEIPDIFNAISATDTIVLVGDLGAGKTTLVSYIAQYLGVTDEVSSPTFALINEYIIPSHNAYKKILHSDWYRLSDENEAIEAGIEDMLEDKDALKFIEWPSKAPSLLPNNTLQITIKSIDETRRCLSINLFNEKTLQ